MLANDPYADIAPFYDLEFDSFDSDVELYLGYANLVGGPVLELGCGTGRILAPLASAGFEVTGLDSSASMIELARQRLDMHDQAERVQLAVGDMRDLTSYRQNVFRLVFSAINSFLHLEDRDQQLEALRMIRQVLDRDGLLVLDLFQPTPETLMRMDDRYSFDASWTDEHRQEVQRFSHRQLDVASQTIHTRLFYDVIGVDGNVRRRTTSYKMRYVHRFEMESLLAESGFEMEGVYGSYTLDPLERESEQMIFVAHRTPNAGEN